MKQGLLWLADNGSIEQAIQDAAHHYQERFGTVPNLCFVNRQDWSESLAVEGMTIKAKVTIMPHHIWIGVVEP